MIDGPKTTPDQPRATASPQENRLRYFASILANVRDSVIVTDLGGTIEYWNAGATALFGYSEEEAIGRSVAMLYPDADPAKLRADLEAIRHGADYNDVWRGRRKDGDVVWVDVKTSAMRDENGVTTGFIGVAKDVTERHRAEEALARANAELEHFAYAASHDLKEPLRKILSFGDLLKTQKQVDLPPKLRDYIDRMQRAADRMSEMIDGLLAFSRVGRETEVENVDLTALVRDLLTYLQLPPDARVEIGDLPAVQGNRVLLRQMFQNFIANAAKFRSAEPLVIGVEAQRHNGEWRIAVRDNGIGIDPQHHDRIFQMFQRLHTRGQYPGTGIGLATAKKIIERHGGKVWVESEPGKGTAFFVTLPANG